jgi:hypothetical protein
MHGRLALVGLCATLLLLLSAGPAAADNDDFAAAKPLFLGATDSVSNGDATIQPGESLTPQGLPSLDRCVVDATSSQADKTLWWWVNGTGRPLTISTAGSDFDTQLGIFSGPLNGGALCQDADLGGETVTFDSIAGKPYWIQVGGCVLNTAEGCEGNGPTGVVRLSATTPAPANDRRAAAALLPTGQPVAGDNYGAGEEEGESTECDRRPYGRTVWYRWTAATAGTLNVTVSAPGATLAVFPQTGDALDCFATPGGQPRVSVQVSRGDYLVQVGGLGAHAGLSGDSAQAAFTVQAAMTAGGDRDNDGVLDAADCRPGDARVHPGALDRPSNGVDEDCNGRDATYPKILSRVRLAVQHFPTYAKVTALSVRSVPAGARLQVRCSGTGCPFRRSRPRTLRRARGVVSLMTARLRSAKIVPRTTLEVRVTRAGRIGRIERFLFRRAGRDPSRQTRCLDPGASAPTLC